MNPHRGRPLAKERKAFIDNNFSDEAWKSFDEGEALPAGKSEAMLRAIQEGIVAHAEAKQHKKIKVIQLVRYVSAASVFLMLGLAIYFSYTNTGTQRPAQKHTIAGITRSAAPESIWQQVSNTGKTTRKFRLPDSSLVTIYPASRIRFERKFNAALRTVYLNGKAKFKVQHNTARPFSVYSGALKTTALGTSFTINTAAPKKHISVQLHTGKIVIANTLVQQSRVYISTPGTILLYSGASKRVQLIDTSKPADKAAESLKKEGNIIKMKNIPLAEVIRLLSKAYNLRIQANTDEISSITFTGQVDTGKEQAEDVLNMICTINNMTLIRVSPQEFNIQKSNK